MHEQMQPITASQISPKIDGPGQKLHAACIHPTDAWHVTKRYITLLRAGCLSRNDRKIARIGILTCNPRFLHCQRQPRSTLDRITSVAVVPCCVRLPALLIICFAALNCLLNAFESHVRATTSSDRASPSTL